MPAISLTILGYTFRPRYAFCASFATPKETAAANESSRFLLEIHETDIAVWQIRETPPLSDCNLGDFTPLTAYRDVGTENEQLCAIGDAPAAGQNLFAYRYYLGVQNGLLRWCEV